jgi:hypothetical protein
MPARMKILDPFDFIGKNWEGREKMMRIFLGSFKPSEEQAHSSVTTHSHKNSLQTFLTGMGIEWV